MANSVSHRRFCFCIQLFVFRRTGITQANNPAHIIESDKRRASQNHCQFICSIRNHDRIICNLWNGHDLSVQALDNVRKLSNANANQFFLEFIKTLFLSTRYFFHRSHYCLGKFNCARCTAQITRTHIFCSQRMNQGVFN